MLSNILLQETTIWELMAVDACLGREVQELESEAGCLRSHRKSSAKHHKHTDQALYQL